MATTFDVFLSHNSRDKGLVAPIAAALSSHSSRVWFDETEIQPGDSVYETMQTGLAQSRCIAVFMGPSGLSVPVHRFYDSALVRSPAAHPRRARKFISHPPRAPRLSSSAPAAQRQGRSR